MDRVLGRTVTRVYSATSIVLDGIPQARSVNLKFSILSDLHARLIVHFLGLREELLHRCRGLVRRMQSILSDVCRLYGFTDIVILSGIRRLGGVADLVESA